MKDPLSNYHNKLRAIPAPGAGCHPYLLTVAHAGIKAKLPHQQIFGDIRSMIPVGKRCVKDREIWDAIEKAAKCQVDRTCSFNIYNIQPPKILPKYLTRLIERGSGTTETDLLNASPVAIPPDIPSHAQLLLDTLYESTDIVFIGDKYDKLPKPVHEWKNIAHRFPHIMPNTLSGGPAQTQDGKLSYRCDACVSRFQYALVEFDNLSRDEQLAFWAAIPLPIVALIDTGGKSIHGWIKISGISSLKEWNTNIKLKLYKQRLEPLGVDKACANASRLSRLPGHFRAEKQRFQRLLYLDPSPYNPSQQGILY